MRAPPRSRQARVAALPGALLVLALLGVRGAAADSSLPDALAAEAERLERRLAESPRRLPDHHELAVFIRELACRLDAERCGALRLHVLRSPEANAFMLPNGAMAVFTGLMLRTVTEAELAFVIAHEIGHHVERHAEERWGSLHRTGNLLNLVAFAAGATGEYRAGAIAELGIVAALFAYSRGQEREADRFAAARMGPAGYPLAAGASLFAGLLAEERARPPTLPTLFATHPPTRQRVRTLERLAAETAPPAAPAPDRGWRELRRRHLEAWIEDELGRRSRPDTLVLLERLERAGDPPAPLRLARADILRRAAKPADLAQAEALIRSVLAEPEPPARAWRLLGQVAKARGDARAATEAFRRYLELDPAAPDRKLIEWELQ
ncbi:MAG: M48 family metalloprotease [Xanthomonadales bacterium]|nr:M48 family metalloprotease [Xanthomonadales bacterium]